MRKRITTDGQPGKKGRRDREQGGKSETRHEGKITELKKKIFSNDESVGRAKTHVEPGEIVFSELIALPGSTESRPTRMFHRIFTGHSGNAFKKARP